MGSLRDEILYIGIFPTVTVLSLCLLYTSLPLHANYPGGLYYIALLYGIIIVGAFTTAGMILLRLIIHRKYGWSLALVVTVIMLTRTIAI